MALLRAQVRGRAELHPRPIVELGWGYSTMLGGNQAIDKPLLMCYFTLGPPRPYIHSIQLNIIQVRIILTRRISLCPWV